MRLRARVVRSRPSPPLLFSSFSASILGTTERHDTNDTKPSRFFSHYTNTPPPPSPGFAHFSLSHFHSEENDNSFYICARHPAPPRPSGGTLFLNTCRRR
jgi:hypothetical protein